MREKASSVATPTLLNVNTVMVWAAVAWAVSLVSGLAGAVFDAAFVVATIAQLWRLFDELGFVSV
jgi:hypothetical protein